MFRFYLYIFILSLSGITSAQEVDTLFIGAENKIRIIDENSIEYEGKLYSLNDEVLILSFRDGGTKSTKREFIDKIEIYRGKKSYQALIGSVIGFFAGDAVGFKLGGRLSSDGHEPWTDEIKGAQIGAIGGLVVGTFLGLAGAEENGMTFQRKVL